MAKMLTGKSVADSLYQAVDQRTQGLLYGPTLLAIGSNNPQWTQYVNSLANSCVAHNVILQPFFVTDNYNDVASDKEQIRAAIKGFAPDGILIEQPLPQSAAELVELIPAEADIDCCTNAMIADLYRGGEGYRPATAQAVLAMLDYYGIDLAGKRMVIVGRGNAVGKPLAFMALGRNATVTICHSKTENIAEVCRSADVLVSATGKPGLITADFVTENSVVIDVGLSFVGGKTCGDVAKDVYAKCAAVSPVPGGIGPVTRAVLLYNLTKNYTRPDQDSSGEGIL